MPDISTIRRLSCYAVLNIGFSGENYLLPHMRLVLSLIANKSIKKIDARDLVDQFLSEYQYKIDFFPMKKILGLAASNGYLEKIRNDRHFKPTEKIAEFKTISNEIASSQRELLQFADAFQKYALTAYGVDYSQDKVNDIILSYINTRKLVHISGRIETPDGDKRIDYLFGKFIYEIKQNQPSLLSFLTKLVTGSILADCLVFHEQLSNGRQLDGVTVIFDTAVVFMALGIDEAKRQEYYVNLITSLKSKGARVAMFLHSYNEMQYIILGASEWVESALYDPMKASETCAYFRSENATKIEVIEYSNALKQHISDLGIEIIDVDYDKSSHPYYEDESKIYSMITERYAATNPNFNETIQKRSIELDARSISHVYLLRKGQMPMHISDAGYLFVTANNSLNKVASDYHRSSGKLEKSLPTSVTDVFLGTYLWLSDPVKTAKMNEQMIISHAYLAFQPNTELIGKLVNTVISLLEKEEITSDTCYALMGNKLVLDKLAEKTLGDPEAYQENTPLEILQELIEQGRRAGVEEEKAKLNKWKQVKEAEQESITKQYKENELKLSNDLINMTKEAIIEAENKIYDLNTQRQIAKNYRKKWKIGVVTAFVLWTVINIIIAVLIWTFDIIKDTNWLDLITITIEITTFAVPLCFTCITNKELNLSKAIGKFLDKRYFKKCQKLKCSDDEIKLAEDRLDRLKNNLSNYETKAGAA